MTPFLLASPLRQITPSGVTAIRVGGSGIDYARLRSDVDAVALRLRAAGVEAGSIVGVSIRQAAAHWCVTLALLRLGAVSVSLTDRIEAELAVIGKVSAVVQGPGDPTVVGSPTARRIAVDPSWFEPADGHLPPLDVAERTLGRICFTSGTSGRPRAVVLTGDMLRARLAKTPERSLISGRSAVWVGLGPDSAYGFTANLAAWLQGGTVVFGSEPERLLAELVRGEVNLVISSAFALGPVLKLLRFSGGSRPSFAATVIVVGGHLTSEARTLLEETGSDVRIAYGTSETGGITLAPARVLGVHPGAVGCPFRDVRVEIVGDADEEIAEGSPGRVRLRSDSSATEYLHDPDATARHFADGWFYPGDLGMIEPDGTLVLLGRETDILNVGGVKLLAADIERVAAGQPGVSEAGAFMLGDGAGGSRLGIAVVAEHGLPEGLPERIRSALPSLPRFTVVQMPEMPRNPRGKVDRAALSRIGALAMQEADRAPAPPTPPRPSG